MNTSVVVDVEAHIGRYTITMIRKDRYMMENLQHKNFLNDTEFGLQ